MIGQTRLCVFAFNLSQDHRGRKSDRVGGCDLWVEFPLDEIDLAAAAQQLREQLQQFRQRARV